MSKGLRRQKYIFWVVPIVCFCMVVLPIDASSQSQESGSGFPKYYMNCTPLDSEIANIHFSASFYDVFENVSSSEELGNGFSDSFYFRVQELVYDEIGEEGFLKGFLFEGEANAGKREAIRFPIAKGRKENEYWNEDKKTRSVWFVRGKEWRCDLLSKI